jgi:hypothetical protein
MPIQMVAQLPAMPRRVCRYDSWGSIGDELLARKPTSGWPVMLPQKREPLRRIVIGEQLAVA